MSLVLLYLRRVFVPLGRVLPSMDVGWPGGPPAYPVADAESLLGAIVSNTVREHAPIAYTFCGICCVTSGLSTFYLSMCGCFCLRLHTRR